MNLEIGSTVGDYQIIDILGAGGMGKVFKVRNTISDRIEALKVLLPDLVSEPDLADRFLREIKVLASLNHPNIAGLRTALRVDNQLLMVMELVEGMTLEHRLQQGPLPVAEATRCIGQVLSALAYAHGQGVVHRDIKPANMMVMADGVVKLMDFGIAKGAADRKLTMTGTTMGSLYYMSPEQIRGEQTLDPRSDLYSVGVSLYELVTGKRPFDGDSQFAIMSAHLEKSPVPPITLDPRLPETLNDLILFSVNRDPGARFQSAEAFRNALSSVGPATAAAGAGATMPAARPVPTTTAPPPPTPRQAPAAAAVASPPVVKPAAQSHRAAWATLGALCCVGILVAIIQFGPFKKTSAGSAAPANAAAPVAATPDPAPSSPAASVPPPTATAPDPAPSSTPTASTPPPVTTPVSSSPRPNRPAPSSGGMAAAPAQTPATQQQAAPIPQQPAVNSAPVPAQAQAQQQQAEQAAQRAELQKLRISLVTMSARAASVRSTLQGIQTRQAATGFGMRGDWLQSASLMDTFFQGANDALSAGDAPAAKDLMEKGERELAKLEKALNK